MKPTITTIETLIRFEDGEPTIKSNQSMDDATTALIIAILSPFLSFPESRERVTSGYPVRIRAVFHDSIMESYSIGFTHSTKLQITQTHTTANV
jgi:hypothetical protein